MTKVSICRQAGRAEVAISGDLTDIAAFLAAFDPGADEQCIQAGLQFPLDLGRVLGVDAPVRLPDGSSRLVLYAERASFVESECDPTDPAQLPINARWRPARRQAS